MSRRILHLPDDPRAVAVLDEWPQLHRDWWGDHVIEPIRGAVESLAARGIVPDKWTHDDRVYSLFDDGQAASLLVLRNPGALIAAERLLLDELARCAQEHGSPVGRYVGVRSWDTLCAQSYAAERGGYLPSARRAGVDNAGVAISSGLHPDVSAAWLGATSGTGSSYGGGGELVWRMADQLATGAPWITALYETGFGLWCWREAWENCEWALIVRPGDGLPWPEYEESES